MNAEQLIDEIVDIILDTSFTREWILDRLNRAMKAVAGKVLLPGLSDGYSSVDTVLGENITPLPDDYHRNIYLADVVGVGPVKICQNIGIMRDFGYNLDLTSGSIECVAPNALSLFYQRVPSTVKTINLRYYRKPVDMEDKDSSFPDAVMANPEIEEDMDKALTAHVCGKIFARLEQGLEGNKVDTSYYENQFKEAIADIDDVVAKARPRMKPTVVKVRWP